MRNQALFNYLSTEHGVILLESELDEIVRIVKQADEPKLPYDYDFFVPCSKDQSEEVFELLQKAGFQRWESKNNVWTDGDNGIFVDHEGDCMTHEMDDITYPLITIYQLREFIENKK